MSGQGVTVAGFVPDRFQSVQQQQAELGTGNLYRNVRRPVRGIQLKNETFATIRIFKGSGEIVPLVDAGSRDEAPSYGSFRASNVYSNFFVQQVEDQRAEKQQIVQTFGQAYIFLYGEQPRILNISGVLLNTFDFNWEAEWWWNYENYLRGSKCVENDARVFITIDDMLVSGYIIGAAASKQAQERNWIPFQFQLFVTGYSTLSRLGDPSADQEGREAATTYERKEFYTPLTPEEYLTKSVSIPVSGGKADPYRDSLADQVKKSAAILQDRIDKVRNYWSKISNTVANLDLTVDTIFGSPIRIPEGWAGAIEFDDPATRFVVVNNLDANPVKFTVFADNSDEYVSDSLQYNSALHAEAARMYDAQTAYGDLLLRPSLMVDKARAEWAKYGIYPPDEGMVKFVANIRKTKIGAKLVGKAEKVVRQAVGATQDAAAIVDQAALGLTIGSAALGAAQAGISFAQAVPDLANLAAASATATAAAVGAAVTNAANDIAGRSGSAAPQG